MWEWIKNKLFLKTISSSIKKLDWEIDTEKIFKLLKPTIRIQTKRSNSIPKGKSKFGGQPDLPLETKWPINKEKSLSFIAQINLSQINSLDKERLLPKNGMLYFFLNTADTSYSFPEKEGEFKVLFFEGNTSLLQARKFPEDLKDNSRFPSCKLNFFEYYTIPSYQNYQIEDFKLTSNDSSLLEDVRGEFSKIIGDNWDVGHQLLGEAQAQQGDVNFYWAFNDLGLESYELTEKQRSDIKTLEKEFVLLFQVDFIDDNTNFKTFGSTATAYFGIKKDDLINKRFDKTRLVIQMT